MLMQVAQGYARLQPTLYLKIVGVIALPTAFAVVALAMGVHAIVNQKFVGHLIVIAYWIVLPVMSNIGFDHRLYQVGGRRTLCSQIWRAGAVSPADLHDSGVFGGGVSRDCHAGLPRVGAGN